MKKYLTDTIEWMARKLLAHAATRAVAILDELEADYEAPKSLPAPRLPAIEYKN